MRLFRSSASLFCAFLLVLVATVAAPPPTAQANVSAPLSLAVNPLNYTYSARPVIPSLPDVLYVQTNNPDPTSFRLVDRNSKYAQSGKTPTYVLSKHIYRDVKYENAATYRVRNGYIFELWNGYESAGGGISIGVEYGVGGYSDGGALTIQAKNSSGKYTDTHKTVNVSAMKDSVDYLISNYGGAGGDLFTKLDAIQSKLTQIALYPTAVQDSSKPTGRYPCLQAPLHNDQNYFLDNIHAVYEQVPNSLLSTAAYPYVLDSLGFPGLMASVARRLDPAVEVKSTYAHYLINIAKGTQNKSYGGAGNGGSDPVYTKNITQGFLFDGTSTDIGSGNNLNKIYAYVLNLKKQATADAKALKQQINGYTIAQTIGNGAWLDTVGALTYFTTDYIIDNNIGPYANAVRDTWVDGRYVNDRLRLEPGATFDKYPTSGILIRNYTYTDKNGASHTRDVLFRYQKGTKDWRAEILYWVNNSFYYSDEVLPQSLILTAAEVKALQVDRNTKILPTKGFSYNCKVAPGTPFTHQGVTGISLPKNLTFVANGKLEDVTATVSPSNAYNKAVEWTSSNPNVVGIYYSNNNSSGQPYAEIRAKSAGTAVLTATTVDGRYKASTTITVTTSPQPAARVSTSYSPWVDAAKSCATHQVAQTRTKTVTTTPYVWNSTQHAWVLGSTTTKVTTETQTRAMTDAEWKACSPQPAARVSTSYSPWVDAAKSCATHQVAQTRIKTVTTTPYVWNSTRHAWVLGSVAKKVTTETQMRMMNASEVAACKARSSYCGDRIWGATRVETSVAIGRCEFPLGAKTAYLASMSSTADALAAGSLTAGPVVLNQKSGLSNATRAYLLELKKQGLEKVFLLGGSGVLDNSVASQVSALGLPVGRLAGSDRFGTAVAIARHQFPNGFSKVYVTDGIGSNGLGSPDAVVGGVLTGGPILFGSKIAPMTADTRSLVVGKATVQLGGNALKGFRAGSTLAGADRFATATKIAAAAKNSATRDTVYLANGIAFVDAVAGGELTDGTMLLTQKDTLPTITCTYLHSSGAKRVVALGGIGAVSQKVLSQARSCLR